MWIKDKNEYNRVSYFFVSIIFFPNGSVSNPQEAEKKSCMQNQPTADGSSSIFISICATLGNFSKNMLIQSFLSDLEIHKAPLSEWSLYFPRLGLSWMLTFSLLRILVNLKKGSFTRNNLCCHYPHEHRWQGDMALAIWKKAKKLFFPFTVPCICWHLLGENAEKLKHEHFVEIQIDLLFYLIVNIQRITFQIKMLDKKRNCRQKGFEGYRKCLCHYIHSRHFDLLQSASGDSKIS